MTAVFLPSPSPWPDSVPQLFQRRRVQPVPVPAAEGPGDEGHGLPSSLIGQALLRRHPTAWGMHWADAPGGCRRLLLRRAAQRPARARQKAGSAPHPAPRGGAHVAEAAGPCSGGPSPRCPAPAAREATPRESGPAPSGSRLPSGQAPPHLSPSPPLQ